MAGNTSVVKIYYSIKSVKEVIKAHKPSKVCLVTPVPLIKKLSWVIEEINIPKSQIVLIPDGEKAKEWKELESLLKKLSDLNLDRNSLVIALGGGTLGDIVGFATAIYLRGIKYIQVPTTLLAQVDSAHGGKTGINFLEYKNQIGCFHTPVATVIDDRVLKSLSTEQIVDGLGEIIKAGFIKDPSILRLLSKHTIHNLVGSLDLVKIIKKSIAVKNYFTEKDFKDNGVRQLLNVGHTLGHSIELKYKISHGKAVLIGMVQELKITELLKITPMKVRESLEKIIGRMGIKLDLDMKADWNTILHDKKIKGKSIDFPVIVEEGKAKILKLKLEKLRKAIK